ncbi:hypothetical protein BH11ACT6_BH11ACT6_21540 [soil metagenome]
MKTYVLPPTAAMLAAALVAVPALSSAYPVEPSRIALASTPNSIAVHSYSSQRGPSPDGAGLPIQTALTLTAWNTFVTSLTPGLPQPVAAAAATPPYDFLDVLGLPIQTAFAIVAGGTAGVTLPTSPLIPSPYTSLYTVINNAIAVLRVPLSLALTGQFSDIVPQTQAAFTTFVTSLTQGLPSSIRGTLEWDLSVLSGFLNGITHAAVPATRSAAAEQTGTAPEMYPVAEATSATAEVTAPGDFMERLPSAVDKHLDAPAVDRVDVAATEAPIVETQPTENGLSHESDSSDDTADAAEENAVGDKGAAAQAGANGRKAERDSKSEKHARSEKHTKADSAE